MAHELRCWYSFFPGVSRQF